MESVNPKNFIDIDPYTVSFITLKDGNMVMIDESTPAKPNKVKIISEEEKNNDEPMIKPKLSELALSEHINFFFVWNKNDKKEIVTVIKKSDFNLISSISNNIYFSFINNNKDKAKKINGDNNKNNIPSTNSSIDIKSSMFNTKREINENNLNNNILSEDNVNIISNQIKNNINGKKIDGINSLNIFPANIPDNNFNTKNNKLSQKNEIMDDTQKYTFDENDGGNKGIFENNNMKIESIPNNQNEQIINNNINHNNFNKINEQYEHKEQSPYINNPSLIIQNNNFYSQNNFPSNNMNINNQNLNSESDMNIIMNKTTQVNRSTSQKRYNRINRIKQKKKDNNYIKAVVSINIPGEDQENINLVKQFNSLVDRLNGQKSQTQAKEIIKRSDRYYELYKNPNENLLNSFLSPHKNKKRVKKNYFLEFSNNINNSINTNINDISNTSYYGKYNNLNSRILALKERSFTSMNNSFKTDNNKIDNVKNNNPEIVLPSNFLYNK